MTLNRLALVGVFISQCTVSVLSAGLPGGDCIEPCIMEMQKTLESTPIMQNEQFGQLSFSQLAGASADRQLTEKSFAGICEAYVTVDQCLERCERNSENSGRIRQTYAGIRFICVEHKKEFFESLPCLAKYEPMAMSQCRREINESLVASNRFSTTVLKREQHNIRVRFEALCKQLGGMINCVEPVTRAGCGDQAAAMMLRFITVGFSSFEQLYSQLGISDQLPATCRSLLTLRHRLPETSHPLTRHSQSQKAGRAAKDGRATSVILSLSLAIAYLLTF